MYQPNDNAFQSTIEQKVQLVDAVDAAFANRSPSPSVDDTDTPKPLRSDALWQLWGTELLPYYDRIEMLWLPTVTLGGEIPRRPFNSPYGLVILAVQPQGWTERERRRWRQRWLNWVTAGGGILDNRIEGLGLSTLTESTAWVWAFTLFHHPTLGWQWGAQFPAIPQGLSAADPTPLTRAVERALQVSLKHPDPIHLIDRERWACSQMRQHVYPLPAQAARALERLLYHIRYSLASFVPFILYCPRVKLSVLTSR